MLFHTSTFVIFFLLFLLVYVPARRTRAGPLVILAFSCVFYGWWSWKFLGLLWVTLVMDYSLARLLAATESPTRRKLIVTISLVTNLGILGFFKYFNFFVESAAHLGVSKAAGWRIEDIVLPVGISFYIFQSLSYTIDVYRRQESPVRNFIDYAAFVCYFPQLVAGPIERLSRLLPQIVKPAPITPDRVVSGAFLFAVGFFRKALADNFATFVDPTFANLAQASPIQVVLAILGFGLQIYLDFTGYVDMARGVSRMVGIDLMINFDAPYSSTSIREFWRRWHISLSQWLRDYLYISLGGNRYGMPRHLANLMITMLLGGLWHGAGLNFLIWGGLHGTYLIINTLWLQLRSAMADLHSSRPVRIGRLEISLAAQAAAPSESPRTGRYIRQALSWLATWLAVNYAWLYFRAPTFKDAMVANGKIGEWLVRPTIPEINSAVVVMVLVTIAMEFLIRFRKETPEGGIVPLTFPRAVTHGALCAVMFLAGLVLLAGVPTQQFIYFQF